MPERHCEYELAVGDTVQIGEHSLTVVDIDGPDVSFRIDPHDSDDGDLELRYHPFGPGK